MVRRVVVTGIGLVTPLGITKERVWRSLVDGGHGIRQLTGDRFKMLPARIAGTVPEDELSRFPFTEHPRFIRLALIAAQEAIKDSKIDLDPSCGVSIGSGMSCVEEIVKEAAVMESRGPRRVSPHFVPRILGNMAAGQISINWHLNGPVFSPSTACATGASAIGEAFRAIKHGDTDVMLAGATESCVDPLSMAGFCQAKALTTRHNDEPGLASRPFDRNRSGFVMGEGAAVLILEELARAKARNAAVLCEVLGYGLSADAHHITASHPGGLGARLAMERAIKEASIRPSHIDYINAHGTSTPLGDKAELGAIAKVFYQQHRPAISSTKGAIGHLLSGAGAVEAAFTAMAIATGTVPPNRNFEQVDEDLVHLMDSISIPAASVASDIRYALTNSFGFGGINVSLCFGKTATALTRDTHPTSQRMSGPLEIDLSDSESTLEIAHDLPLADPPDPRGVRATVSLDQCQDMVIEPTPSPKPIPINLDSESDEPDVVITDEVQPDVVITGVHPGRSRRQPVDLTSIRSPQIQRNRGYERTNYLRGNADSLIDFIGNLFPVVRRQRFQPTVTSRNSIPVLPSMDLKEPEGKPVKLTEIKCGICLEVVTSPASTMCGHIFCFECIRVAQEANKQCPVCRTRLNSKQFHRLFV